MGWTHVDTLQYYAPSPNRERIGNTVSEKEITAKDDLRTYHNWELSQKDKQSLKI